MKKVYGCVVSRDDHYTRKEGGMFNAEEFEKYPERYVSTFSHKVSNSVLTEDFRTLVLC